MQPRYQQALLRKLSDQVKFITRDEFSKVQAATEKTLEKIHEKLLSKTDEASELCKKFRTMVSTSRN